VYQDKLPIDPRTRTVAELFNQQATQFALYGGEDYELLFTVSPADYESIKAYPGIATVGHITEPSTGLKLVYSDGSIGDLLPMGYRHFSVNNA